MPRLSEKYIAGFLDADGYIGLQVKKSCLCPQLTVGFSQKTSKDEVLLRIQKDMGGSIRIVKINNGRYSNLTLCGTTARKCLNRISKYLVVKRHYALFCLSIIGRPFGTDIKEIKATFKKERRRKSLPLPNHPTRKWLAGYFDGDGCLSVTGLRKPFGQAHIIAHIAGSNYDTEGIELIHKNFGGRIHGMCNGRCRQFVLSLNPSKAKQFLSFFGKHSIVKKNQIQFVLGCAKMGHYRDGKSIKAILKQLKAQEQRLSESEVASLLLKVKDLPLQKRTDYGDFVRDKRGRIIGKKAA